MAELSKIKDALIFLKPILVSKYHVSEIGLFGSIVRNDFDPESSDIDIIVDFSRPVGIEFIDLGNFLEEKLKRKVDLVSKKGIKAGYFKLIESQIFYV